MPSPLPKMSVNNVGRLNTPILKGKKRRCRAVTGSQQFWSPLGRPHKGFPADTGSVCRIAPWAIPSLLSERIFTIHCSQQTLSSHLKFFFEHLPCPHLEKSFRENTVLGTVPFSVYFLLAEVWGPKGLFFFNRFLICKLPLFKI